MTTESVPKALADFRAELAKARPQFLEQLSVGLYNLGRRRDGAVLLTALLAEIGDAINERKAAPTKPAAKPAPKDQSLDAVLDRALADVLEGNAND